MAKPYNHTVKPSVSNNSLSKLANSFAKEASDENDVKDIITFLEAPWGLNLNEGTQPLFPAQKFILKLYYKIPLETEIKTILIRDKFNERELYHFTEKEYLEHLYNQGRCNIKYLDDKPRNELVLIVGRRGSKSSLASWIAAYETYKLLKIPHPQKHYGLLPDAEIHLTTLATSEDQANLLFRQILGHFSQSNYFHRFLNKPTADRVSIRSRRDLEKYGEEGKTSIMVKSAPCSARAARGPGNIVVIMDEQAHFVDENAESNKSDIAVYEAITPSVATFKGDGKIINISSPLNKSGMLWDLYNKSLTGDSNLLMIQAPSWEINNTLDSTYLKGRYHNNPITYECEFGGNFSDRVSSWMPEEYLRRIIVPDLKEKTAGTARIPHFMGLDIGFKEDGTSIAVSHIVTVKDEETGDNINKIEIDYVDSRSAGIHPYEKLEVLDFELLADWIAEICNKFFIVKGMVDQHNGMLVTQNLAKRGLHQFELAYHTRQFNSDLYQNFMMLCIDKKLRLYNNKTAEYNDSDLIQELLRLQVVQHSKNVISVESPKLKGQHDDRSDALMRSVWLATEALKGGATGSMSLSNNRKYVFK